MGKTFSERPRWQRWGIIGGWGILGLVTLSVCAGPEPAGRSAKKPADLAAYRDAFSRLALPCEVAQVKVGDGLASIGTGDRVALAQAVNAMEGGCGNAWLGVKDIAQPDDLTEAQAAALDAIEDKCGMAFYLRKELAEALVPVVDGDMRPSVVAGIQTDMAEMQRAVADCERALDAIAPPSPSPLP